jgi:hypothetical protein
MSADELSRAMLGNVKVMAAGQAHRRTASPASAPTHPTAHRADAPRRGSPVHRRRRAAHSSSSRRRGPPPSAAPPPRTPTMTPTDLTVEAVRHCDGKTLDTVRLTRCGASIYYVRRSGPGTGPRYRSEFGNRTHTSHVQRVR